MGVLGQLAVESLQEELVCDFAHVHAGFVQHGDDALVLLLHQVHNDLIVEVVDLTRGTTSNKLAKKKILF